MRVRNVRIRSRPSIRFLQSRRKFNGNGHLPALGVDEAGASGMAGPHLGGLPGGLHRNARPECRMKTEVGPSGNCRTASAFRAGGGVSLAGYFGLKTFAFRVLASGKS